jgi:hypothetical protein
MLKVDDEQKEVRAVEIGTCRGIHMHGTLVELFLNPICRVDVWMSAKSLSGVSAGWAKCG